MNITEFKDLAIGFATGAGATDKVTDAFDCVNKVTYDEPLVDKYIKEIETLNPVRIIEASHSLFKLLTNLTEC
jgi:hypothetical protein